MKRDPVYSVWSSMIQRCHNPKNRQFKDYGGRGITVCDRWRSSFQAFIEDMGPRPAGMTVERVKNHLGYSKENCCWATRQQQNSNKRNCIHLVDVGGERVTLREYCRRRSLSYRAILKRVQNRGWPLALAIMLPSRNGVPDTAMLLELWAQLEQMRDYLRMMIKAAEGQPIADRFINTARLLCDEAEDVRLVA